jgi:hypothetical protein
MTLQHLVTMPTTAYIEHKIIYLGLQCEEPIVMMDVKQISKEFLETILL